MIRNAYVNLMAGEFSDALGRAINQAAAASPSVRALVDELEGKTIRFELTDFNSAFVMHIVDSNVFMDADEGQSTDLTIRTTLAKFVKLLATRQFDPTQFDGVDISGDLKLLQRLYLIFKNIEFDWEEQLAKRVGDIPARQIGNLFRWGERQAQTLRDSVHKTARHTLIDDRYIIPTRERVTEFLNAVDDLKADVDRLEQRVLRIERNTTR